MTRPDVSSAVPAANEPASAATPAADQRVPGKAWAMLAVTYLCSVCAPLCQFKVPASASWLFQVYGPLGLDPVTFGLLMSALSIIGVVLAFPAAWIAKGMGLKNTILLSMGCLCVGCIVFGLAPNVPVLMAGRFLEGVGLGLIGVAAPACVTVWFPPRKRGLALGIWATWVPLGSVLGFNVIPLLAGMGGLQLPSFALAGLCAVALVLFALVFRMPAGEAGDMGIDGSFGNALKLLKNERIIVLGIVFFLFAFAVIGIENTYYNTFLETQLGFSAQAAGSLTSLTMLISLVIAPLTGFITDKLSLARKYVVGMVMMALLLVTGCIMFHTGSNALAVMWAVIILQGIGAGMCGGSLRPMAPMLVRNSAMGATMAMALLQFMQNLGSSLGSPIFGAVMEMLGWEAAGIVLQVPCYALALFLCLYSLVKTKAPARTGEER
ncbi:MAG: nitrate/nitrite transporter [Coriobacteriales bacterium]